MSDREKLKNRDRVRRDKQTDNRSAEDRKKGNLKSERTKRG